MREWIMLEFKMKLGYLCYIRNRSLTSNITYGVLLTIEEQIELTAKEIRRLIN